MPSPLVFLWGVCRQQRHDHGLACPLEAQDTDHQHISLIQQVLGGGGGREPHSLAELAGAARPPAGSAPPRSVPLPCSRFVARIWPHRGLGRLHEQPLLQLRRGLQAHTLTTQGGRKQEWAGLTTSGLPGGAERRADRTRPGQLQEGGERQADRTWPGQLPGSLRQVQRPEHATASARPLPQGLALLIFTTRGQKSLCQRPSALLAGPQDQRDLKTTLGNLPGFKEPLHLAAKLAGLSAR